MLLFRLTLSFSKAIGPFLTLLGPRNLPAYPTRCTIGYLTCGRRLFGAKTIFMIFTCLTLIHVFAQDLITIFAIIFSLLILIFSLLKPFFLQLHYCLFFREYFGNQAGLTNCSGILIWLTGSTHRASAAPPVDKQGFISAS